MRNTICKILCSLIFVSSFITGCSDSNQTSETSSQEVTVEKESSVKDSSEKTESVKTSSTVQTKDEYLSLLEQLVITLNKELDLACNNSLLVFEVWKSALDQNNTSSEVSTFTQPYGEFVSPKEAVQLLSEDPAFTEKNEEIKKLGNDASSLVEKIENQGIPPKYVQLYQDAMKVDELCGYYVDSYPFRLILPTYPRDLEYYDQSVPTFESWTDSIRNCILKFYADEVLYSN